MPAPPENTGNVPERTSGHHLLRWMTIAGAVLVPVGWDRYGLTVSPDYPHVIGLAYAVAALFVAGAVVYGTTAGGAAVVLGLAMAARAYIELRLSLLKQAAWLGELDDLSNLPWLGLSYACNFVAPSLLLIAAAREWAEARRKRAAP
jgi:hypothetical protein